MNNSHAEFLQRGLDRLLEAVVQFANRIVDLEAKVKVLEDQLRRAKKERTP